MLPVAALFAEGNTPERVMDVAAAPGSKTTQIAAKMNNRGAILANEFSASRVKVLHANISRCGIANVALTHFDGRVFGAALPESESAAPQSGLCGGAPASAATSQYWTPRDGKSVSSGPSESECHARQIAQWNNDHCTAAGSPGLGRRVTDPAQWPTSPAPLQRAETATADRARVRKAPCEGRGAGAGRGCGVRSAVL